MKFMYILTVLLSAFSFAAQASEEVHGASVVFAAPLKLDSNFDTSAKTVTTSIGPLSLPNSPDQLLCWVSHYTPGRTTPQIEKNQRYIESENFDGTLTFTKSDDVNVTFGLDCKTRDVMGYLNEPSFKKWVTFDILKKVLNVDPPVMQVQKMNFEQPRLLYAKA